MNIAVRGNRRWIAAARRAAPGLRTEAAALGLLAVFSIVPLAALIRHSSSHGLVFAGSDSPFPGDQFQYEAWIRQLGKGVLAANLLDTARLHHVFLHPMFLLSGLAWRAGLDINVAFLLWKPVAVIAVFLGFRAY